MAAEYHPVHDFLRDVPEPAFTAISTYIKTTPSHPHYRPQVVERADFLQQLCHELLELPDKPTQHPHVLAVLPIVAPIPDNGPFAPRIHAFIDHLVDAVTNDTYTFRRLVYTKQQVLFSTLELAVVEVQRTQGPRGFDRLDDVECEVRQPWDKEIAECERIRDKLDDVREVMLMYLEAEHVDIESSHVTDG